MTNKVCGDDEVGGTTRHLHYFSRDRQHSNPSSQLIEIFAAVVSAGLPYTDLSRHIPQLIHPMVYKYTDTKYQYHLVLYDTPK